MGRPRIVIIGCGYIGAALGAALVGDEQIRARFGDIRGTTTRRGRNLVIQRLGITPRVVTLADEPTLRTVLEGCSAVFVTVAPGRSGGFRATYLDGVEHLLRASEGTELRRIIFTSSSSVYGQTDGSWVDETSPTVPTTESGKVLLEAETRLLAGCAPRNIDATVVRLTGIHGPGRGPTKRIAAIAGTERTDGDSYVNLVHRDDIVTALRRMLDVSHTGVLNLNDDAPTTRREYYNRLIAAANLPPVRWRDAPDASDLGKRVRNELIKNTLDLKLSHPTH